MIQTGPRSGTCTAFGLGFYLTTNEARAKKVLELFLTRQENVEVLKSRSFLNEETKRAYLLGYRTKRNMLAR